MISREEALRILSGAISNKNLIKHSLAVEAVMRRLAKNFGESEAEWGMAGLLHDIDYEQTKNNPEKHSLEGAKRLEELGFDQEIVKAVKAHNEIHGLPRETKLAKALFCTDPMTGLIVAATLVLPDRKINSLTVESVINRFKEKSFARGANRDTIMSCQELNMDLKTFAGLALTAMQEIAGELGL
jgi:putative nucleotidyltransferase with HDIG domain